MCLGLMRPTRHPIIHDDSKNVRLEMRDSEMLYVRSLRLSLRTMLYSR